MVTKIDKRRYFHQILTVNGIWGGVVPPPLLQDFFVKNIGILYAYDFLTLSLKFY